MSLSQRLQSTSVLLLSTAELIFFQLTTTELAVICRGESQNLTNATRNSHNFSAENCGLKLLLIMIIVMTNNENGDNDDDDEDDDKRQ